MALHNELGRQGEQLARRHLEGNGYLILEQNWTCGKAEIDLIASKNGIIVFVEVKTRTATAYGEPEDFVDFSKQKHLEFASSKYIELRKHEGEIRYDIIGIVYTNPQQYRLRHIEDAFWPE